MLLAIDTASEQMSVALTSATEILAEHSWRSANHHTAELAPMAARMLHSSGLTAADLSAVAVAIGPGSYTGLRIGLAFAKGLALAQALPLIGVPTLDIIAYAQPASHHILLAVVRAGRGRIVVGEYESRAGSWEPTGAPVLTNWADVLENLPDGHWLCGEIDRDARAQLEGREWVCTPSQALRRAACLAELARMRLNAGQAADAATLEPVYMQAPLGA
ncbi:MAG: tRNA (adenosine(37)-N6)-threonylcarbamoyltransferase complex dimerization subunit type 1 TsaB [Chloroflexi bacterium]|nr:MAG: tRNA (adenosine(37)-N6)-threonylcarbamoyltransferase complex dimerization subunit type 1 TsaB [Chloroflexota bacterium]